MAGMVERRQTQTGANPLAWVLTSGGGGGGGEGGGGSSGSGGPSGAPSNIHLSLPGVGSGSAAQSIALQPTTASANSFGVAGLFSGQATESNLSPTTSSNGAPASVGSSAGNSTELGSTEAGSALSKGSIAAIATTATLLLLAACLCCIICLVRYRNAKRYNMHNAKTFVHDDDDLLPLTVTSEASRDFLGRTPTQGHKVDGKSFIITPKHSTTPAINPHQLKGFRFIDLVGRAVSVARRDTLSSRAKRLFADPVELQVDGLDALVLRAAQTEAASKVALQGEGGKDAGYAAISNTTLITGPSSSSSRSGSIREQGATELPAHETDSLTRKMRTMTTSTRTSITIKNGVEYREVVSSDAVSKDFFETIKTAVVDIPAGLIVKCRSTYSPPSEVTHKAIGKVRQADGQKFFDIDKNVVIPTIAPLTSLKDPSSQLTHYTLPTTTTQHAQLESSLRTNLPPLPSLPLDDRGITRGAGGFTQRVPLRAPRSEMAQMAQHNLARFLFVCVRAHVPRFGDEVEVQEGDLVVVRNFTEDGWCFVVNCGGSGEEVTQKEGFVPLFAVESMGDGESVEGSGSNEAGKLARYWSVKSSGGSQEPIL
ncbi:hypothetical protein BC830DRAFT_1132222 [Chytriomyces sp. MP71]|nr:hypothetical protein BC830DRAFT_1132222 [Chytriomyces sp. MP71]